MKSKRFLSIIVFVIMFVFFTNYNLVYAVRTGEEGTEKDFESTSHESVTSSSTASTFPIDANTAMNWNGEEKVVDKTQTVLGTIINVIRTVALGIAIIMLTVISIKYMTASPEGKAEYKKTVIGFLVGAIILFATSGILTIIKNVTDSTLKTDGEVTTYQLPDKDKEIRIEDSILP